MTRKLFDDNTNRALLDLTAMFDALSPEYRSLVVMRALRARDHVSTDAGRALDSAIRGSIRMVGYSNPALAISSALLEPVSGSVVKSEKLASATLRVWAESLEELEKLVSTHLTAQGLPTDYPDFAGGRFRGFWDDDSWQREMDWIVELSEAWSEEDIALMLCYVSGRTITLDDQETDEDYAPDNFVEVTSIRDKPPTMGPGAGPDMGPSMRPAIEPEPAPEPEASPEPAREPEPEPAPPSADSSAEVEPPRTAPALPREVAPAGPRSRPDSSRPAILNQCIEYLSSLSPEDGNWNESVPAFVEAVSNIRQLKSAQRERRANLVAARSEITQEFSSDLEFLEQDTSFWSAQGLTELSELDRTLELADSLKRLLTEYRDVRRPGNTLSEELGRRERRFALEPRIIDTMAMMRRAMSGNRGGDGAAAEGETGGDASEQ